MSIVSDLVEDREAPATLKLVDSDTQSPFEITAYQRYGIEKLLRGDITASTFQNVYSQPQWGPIGEEVFRRTYSRSDTGGSGPDGKELWAETVLRVVTGNIGYAPDHATADDEAVELFWAIYNLRLVPAGRHLWVTGTNVSKFSRNCWATGFSRRLSGHFRFLAARLFEGGGVGANYSSDLLATTPLIVGSVSAMFTISEDHPDFEDVRSAAGDRFVPSSYPPPPGWEVVTIDDSREGWVEAWGDMIDRCTVEDDFHIIYDLSAVRPHGAVLKTFGGRASGPAPLVVSLGAISDILAGAASSVTEGVRRITGLEAMEIDHQIAAAIVSGGARRSARLAAMHWTDPEIFDFINCKADESKHWSANISVEIDSYFYAALEVDDPHATAVLDAIAAGMAANGEPGIIDSTLMSADEPAELRITNPCGEVPLATSPLDASGESCNLGSVNLEAFGTDHAGALHAFGLLSRFLYRATLNPHSDAAAGRVEATNRRIGAGLMGLQGWMAAHGHRLTDLSDQALMQEKLVDFRRAARSAANELADLLGTPRPVKVTAVAPTGSIAQMPGCTPGIHPVFARRFIRRVRFSESDPQWKVLAESGHNVVDDVYAAKTKVVEFVIQDAILDRYDESLIEQSDEVDFDQFNRLVGTVQATFCGHGDGNAISATASIPVDADPADLARSIRMAVGTMKGITAFPEASRTLSPLERLTAEQFHALIEFGAPTSSSGDSNDGNCGPGGCPVR